jgi:hypothetical protein
LSALSEDFAKRSLSSLDLFETVLEDWVEWAGWTSELSFLLFLGAVYTFELV